MYVQTAKAVNTRTPPRSFPSVPHLQYCTKTAREPQVGVPMVSDHYDTLTSMEKFAAVLGWIREERKVHRARELLRDRLNYRRIVEKLGLK